MPTPFLSAEWRRLLMMNYAVEPALLQPLVPSGTELDIWDNTCYVSLVGFMFLNTRVKGLGFPFHRNFEEVNLRFYVKRYDPVAGWKRGVVFIREIVPKPAITWVANTLYRERYKTRRMWHRWEENPGLLQVEYAFREKGRWQSFAVQAGLPATDLKPGSEAEFITEHYWGYARHNERRTVEYQVEHAPWHVYPVQQWHADVDFGWVYGKEFQALNTAEPRSVFLAEGSPILVNDKTMLAF